MAYAANVSFSFAPCAYLTLLGVRTTGPDFIFFKSAYYFNGAINVCTYAFWMWKTQRISQRCETSDVSITDYEDLILESDVDLTRADYDDEFEAKRLAAEAVASARTSFRLNLT